MMGFFSSFYDLAQRNANPQAQNTQQGHVGSLLSALLTGNYNPNNLQTQRSGGTPPSMDYADYVNQTGDAYAGQMGFGDRQSNDFLSRSVMQPMDMVVDPATGESVSRAERLRRNGVGPELGQLPPDVRATPGGTIVPAQPISGNPFEVSNAQHNPAFQSAVRPNVNQGTIQQIADNAALKTMNVSPAPTNPLPGVLSPTGVGFDTPQQAPPTPQGGWVDQMTQPQKPTYSANDFVIDNRTGRALAF